MTPLIPLLPSVCFTWGGEAHQIIALVAEDQLTPQAKAAVAELLVHVGTRSLRIHYCQ